MENLQEWRIEDVFVYLENFQHIVMISDKHKWNGIPYIIHNSPPFVSTALHTPIHAHYRWNFLEDTRHFYKKISNKPKNGEKL